MYVELWSCPWQRKMFGGPWAVLDGFQAVATEDRCWAMAEEDENCAVVEEYNYQDALGGRHDNHDDKIIFLFLDHRGYYKIIIK